MVRSASSIISRRIIASAFIFGFVVLLFVITYTKHSVKNDSIVNRASDCDYANLNSIWPKSGTLGKIATTTLELLMESENIFIDIWMEQKKPAYDDPLLVDYVRETYLLPADDLPYNLTTKANTNPSAGQVQSLWNILQNMTNGFFFDTGAHDGEFLSNSLWLEKEKGWDGILVEANVNTFSKLRLKHRKAWHANACISPNYESKKHTFYQTPIAKGGGTDGLRKRPQMYAILETKVQCFPFYTIMLALNRTVIDFFSLDIEGFELEVLKTIPFDKITIKTLAVEYASIPEGAEGLKKFMEENGYSFYKTVIKPGSTRDSLFVLSSILTEYEEKVKVT